MFLYIYSPSDFTTGLPAESGGGSVSGGPWSFTLVAGATPTLIEVNDDDLIFDELDTSQVLASAVNIDGVAQAAGTTVHSSYDLLNSTTGHRLTGVHFGGTGNQTGAIDGFISTQILLPGSTYTFNQGRTSHTRPNAYQDYVACFTTGALIETPNGPVPVEDLRKGDLVLTLDHGAQPLETVLSRHIDATVLQAKPNLYPVRITSGALGQGLPLRDLLVSPQHRFLARSQVVKRVFDTDETLLSAKQLTVLAGIEVDHTPADVTYFHLVFARHEIVIAEGTPTESFYCGPMAVKSLDPAARAELFAIFPELAAGTMPFAPARDIPSTRRQKQLVNRLYHNEKPVLADKVFAAA